MVEPISTTAAILSGLAAASQGTGSFLDSIEKGKSSKRDAKEKKRRTLAELLNAALGREFEAGEGIRKRGADLAQGRASAMQNVASQYVQALR